MKRIFGLMAIVLMLLIHAGLAAQFDAIQPRSQQNDTSDLPRWMNITSSREVTCLAQEDNYLWIGTSNGLRRMDLATKEQILYTPENSGLPSSWITNIVVDNYKNKWISLLGNGLVFYDGVKWEHYHQDNSRLVHNEIDCLAIDIANNLWIGTRYGLMEFDGKNWITFDNYNSPIGDKEIYSMTVDSKGNVWIGGSDFLGVWDGVSIKTVTGWEKLDRYLYCDAMCVDLYDNLWFSNYNRLYKFDGDTFTDHSPDVCDDEAIWIYQMACYCNNNLWMEIKNLGVYRKNGNKWMTYSTQNSPLQKNNINCILLDSDNRKWLGTDYGLLEFDNNTWNLYNNDLDGIPSNEINGVYFDDTGTTWICTYSDGLIKYDGNAWIVYNMENSGLPSDDIFCLAIADDGDLWIGTGKGLVKYDGITWKVFNKRQGNLPDDFVRDIEIDSQGRIWVGTDGGLAVMELGTWTQYTSDNSELPDNDIECLAIGPDDALWIGTDKGLVKFVNGNWIEDTDFPERYVTDILIEGNGTIWIASLDYISKREDSQWQKTSPEDLGINYSFFMYVTLDAEGGLWSGCADAVMHFKNGKWHRFDSENSALLPASFYGPIAVDKHNNKWIPASSEYFGSGTGITVYNENGIQGFK